MLLGSLPCRSVEVSKGRWVPLDPSSLEEWAASDLMVPVTIAADPSRLVGWCDKVKFDRGKAWLFGELDAGMPEARGVANLVRRGRMDGLSPTVSARMGEVLYKATGRWGPGHVVALPQLSFVWRPEFKEARWLGV